MAWLVNLVFISSELILYVLNPTFKLAMNKGSTFYPIKAKAVCNVNKKDDLLYCKHI